MKFAILLIFLATTLSNAQFLPVELKFETNYYEAVDKWVAFPKKDNDTTYTFGFIYLDDQAGFTFDYFSKFIIVNSRLKSLPRGFNESLKSRLAPNTALVAVLTERQMTDLALPNQPQWLSSYKKDSDKVPYLKNIGFHYNHVGASYLALEPLNKAYAIDPHFEGLEFELAYAYNALKRYDQAIKVLESAIENNPNSFYFYRELGYALRYINQLDQAEKIYKQGIKISKDEFEKSEMAVNMAQAYFLIRDRKKFDEWAKVTRMYAKKGSRYAQFVDSFEQMWNEK
jgi:tetratricopeptide (TPR) repeat protein